MARRIEVDPNLANNCTSPDSLYVTLNFAFTHAPLLFDYWSHVSHFHRLASHAALRSTDTDYVEIHRACLLWCRSTLSFDSVLHFYSLWLGLFRRFDWLLACDLIALSAIIVVSVLEFLCRLHPQILFLTFLYSCCAMWIVSPNTISNLSRKSILT